MAGRTDPPEGTPGGAPGAGDEEYQSTVFDESFVRAARLQEYSARQRLEDHTTAVRTRAPEAYSTAGRTVPKQGIALALIILMAFAAAIYLGANNPYDAARELPADPPAAVTVALAPEGEVPGAADAAALYADGPAEDYGAGAGGVDLPDPRATAHFSREQVLTALTLAKEYVVASALTPGVLAGTTTVPVRELLGAEQQRQFDGALNGQDARWGGITDWLVRFDEAEAELVDQQVRVEGDFSFSEITDDVLQVEGHHVSVYALRPAGAPAAPVALFTVQRQLRFQFGEEELRDRNVVLRQADTLAGPMDCAADPSAVFHPLLAGESATQPASEGVDPYALDGERAALCGTFAVSDLPSPAAH
ncbi:SCO2583 family membrane protein [Streptomyces litchfieldiae]|uniref:Uncharacterized protein n=1 Tax=Streptomyces litchfieldiae TaxID=3075543 RepID=A0ABU2MMV3_9ACTN|nr:hypothetical protein [Streptomyces sp. DSM 44938]MDT0342732.1 hypothetical protein [Streptomyces sp. DSM 44938]